MSETPDALPAVVTCQRRAWVARVRRLDPEMLAPQHGQPFAGKAMVKPFLDWFEQLQCGTDLLSA